MTHTPALKTLQTLRIATYNIAKGVQGVGPARRLEIHNLGLAVEQLDADVVCLQEVRKHNHQHARHFARWPEQPQADFLAPQGYQAVYQTNAVTRHGEHGNALLTRWPVVSQHHEDMSDHPLEQRGLLHVVVQIDQRPVHVVVLHLGLIAGSRARQIAQLGTYLQREVPANTPLVVAGDLNDWGSQLRPALNELALYDCATTPPVRTFPARLPLAQLDYVYARGLTPLSVQVPRGRAWWRMSDHLPLIAEFGL